MRAAWLHTSEQSVPENVCQLKVLRYCRYLKMMVPSLTNCFRKSYRTRTCLDFVWKLKSDLTISFVESHGALGVALLGEEVNRMKDIGRGLVGCAEFSLC